MGRYQDAIPEEQAVLDNGYLGCNVYEHLAVACLGRPTVGSRGSYGTSSQNSPEAEVEARSDRRA
jgi:hypothetical protein